MWIGTYCRDPGKWFQCAEGHGEKGVYGVAWAEIPPGDQKDAAVLSSCGQVRKEGWFGGRKSRSEWCLLTPRV